MRAKIRPVTSHDVPALVELSLLAWAPVFASFRHVLGSTIYALVYPDWQAQQREVVMKACAEGADTVVWVAEMAGTVVGFIAYILQHGTKTGVVDLLAVL
jgi:hypothetical protein